MNPNLINEINSSLEIELMPSISTTELREQLATHINYLINTNFEKLVFYLYRIDVDETKMRNLLRIREGEDAAYLLADLIIDRQLQKIDNRKKFKGGENISDEDRW